MNRPALINNSALSEKSPRLRKEGDSNPRYGNPYGSLANCWFQPLTQTSSVPFRCPKSICSQMRVQRYEVFFSYANFSRIFSALMLIFFDIYFFCFFFRHVRSSLRVLKSFLTIKPMPCVLSDERVKYLSFVWL